MIYTWGALCPLSWGPLSLCPWVPPVPLFWGSPAPGRALAGGVSFLLPLTQLSGAWGWVPVLSNLERWPLDGSRELAGSCVPSPEWERFGSGSLRMSLLGTLPATPSCLPAPPGTCPAHLHSPATMVLPGVPGCSGTGDNPSPVTAGDRMKRPYQSHQLLSLREAKEGAGTLRK